VELNTRLTLLVVETVRLERRGVNDNIKIYKRVASNSQSILHSTTELFGFQISKTFFPLLKRKLKRVKMEIEMEDLRTKRKGIYNGSVYVFILHFEVLSILYFASATTLSITTFSIT